MRRISSLAASRTGAKALFIISVASSRALLENLEALSERYMRGVPREVIALEAHRHGYAEGIALDVAGHVSEGSGENLFVVRDGVLVTPPVAAQLFPGITRDAVRTLASSLGYEVREEAFPQEALYAADELFFTGTAVEITPIRSVDGIVIGAGGRGPITTALQDAFFGIVRGAAPDRWSWLEYV